MSAEQSRADTKQVVPFRGDRARGAPRLIDLDLEAQVVGAVLTDNDLFREVCFLDAGHFSDPVHAELWQFVGDQIIAGRTATPGTLAMSLGERLHDLGGRDFLSGLASYGDMIAPAICDAAERLRQLAQWRRLMALGNDITEWARSQSMSPDDAFSALLREAEGAIQSGRPTARTKRQVARAAISEALEPRDPVTTGVDSLDFLMHGGLIKKRMTAIGGLFGRGKTILLGSISENLNARGIRHLVISLETPPEDVEIRNCARRLDLNAAQIYDPGDPLHGRFVHNAERYIDHMPDNTLYEWMPGASIDDIHRVIIRARHRFGIEGFILDYWQLIRGRERGMNEEGHLREVANRLAAITRREDLWSLIAAQTDERGKLLVSQGLIHAAALFIRLVREENDVAAFFQTEKSNYTRYADTGTQSNPGMIFDLKGPHFRNALPEDYSGMAHAESGGDFDLG